MTAILMPSHVPPKYTKRSDRPAVQQTKIKVRCKLQDLLDDRGMTRSALSELTGLTSGAIRGLCDNTAKRYDVDTLAVLCAYLECEIGELLEIINR